MKSFNSLRGGGGEKFYPVSRGGHKKFWTSLPVTNDQSLKPKVRASAFHGGRDLIGRPVKRTENRSPVIFVS